MSNRDLVVLGIGLLYSLVEYYLGKTNRIRASSVIELIVILLGVVAGMMIFWGKKWLERKN